MSDRSSRSADLPEPYFSICIPQYNRTAFLLEVIRELSRQTFRDFEICISDDCSTDGREDEVIETLRESGIPWAYRRQERNLRYDGNLRAAIGLSRGRYCYLLGNDDCPSSPQELEFVRRDIERESNVGVVICNFQDVPSGAVIRRMPHTANLGAGPQVAANNFRNFSFVSGVVLHGPKARALSTERWDGSEMYQMYVGSRIIAEGGALLALDRVGVLKDIQVPGEVVDSALRRPRIDPCPIVERKLTIHLLAQLVFDAVSPSLPASERAPMLEYLTCQVLLFIYPYWLFEYRVAQSWNYAAGVSLGMRVRNLVPDAVLGPVPKARVRALYALMTAAGLVVPPALFQRARPKLHKLSKAGFALPFLRALSGRAA